MLFNFIQTIKRYQFLNCKMAFVLYCTYFQQYFCSFGIIGKLWHEISIITQSQFYERVFFRSSTYKLLLVFTRNWARKRKIMDDIK